MIFSEFTHHCDFFFCRFISAVTPLLFCCWIHAKRERFRLFSSTGNVSCSCNSQAWSCSRSSCHCVLLKPEQAGAFYYFCPANHRLKSSPRTPPPRTPPHPWRPFLPVAAHLVQPPACSHSISLIRGRVCPFVHSHSHGRGGTTLSKHSAYLRLLTLIRLN